MSVVKRSKSPDKEGKRKEQKEATVSTSHQPRLTPFTRLIGGTEDEQLGSLRTRRGFQDHPGEQLEDNKQLFSSLVLRDSDVGIKDVLKVICPEMLGGSAAENLPG